KWTSFGFAYRDRTYDFPLVQHGDCNRSSPIPGQSQLVAVLRISKHIGHMSNPAVQYGAAGCYRLVGPTRVDFENLIEDSAGEIVARRIVKQFTVIAPDDAKHRIAQTHSTFDDCVKAWLNIVRRWTDEGEPLARRGLIF